MPQRRTARPYKEAVEWIARNDDCTWLDDAHPSLSACAALVADLYGRSDDEIKADLLRVYRKVFP